MFWKLAKIQNFPLSFCGMFLLSFTCLLLTSNLNDKRFRAKAVLEIGTVATLRVGTDEHRWKYLEEISVLQASLKKNLNTLKEVAIEPRSSRLTQGSTVGWSKPFSLMIVYEGRSAAATFNTLKSETQKIKQRLEERYRAELNRQALLLQNLSKNLEKQRRLLKHHTRLFNRPPSVVLSPVVRVNEAFPSGFLGFVTLLLLSFLIATSFCIALNEVREFWPSTQIT